MTMNGEVNSDFVPTPWFGTDIGGTLTKIVYFERKNVTSVNEKKIDSLERQTATEIQKIIHQYLLGDSKNNYRGICDRHLQMDNVLLRGCTGTLYFIRFSTDEMECVVNLAKSKKMLPFPTMVCCTGGGANKFQNLLKQELDLDLQKCDECISLLIGLSFIEDNSTEEFYYLEKCPNSDIYQKVSYKFKPNYPFLVVNIGSGVSVLSVRGPSQFSRVSGSSIGGGTFLGLCGLLTGCNSFEEAILLASKGDSNNVDKLVRDIYGGDYEAFGLTGDVIASSFGSMHLKSKRENASSEDLARCALVTVTNNISAIANLCALNENIDRVIFVGNFLRVNSISLELLTYGMSFWSKGQRKSFFVKHEGYLGAVGCLVQSLGCIAEH